MNENLKKIKENVAGIIQKKRINSDFSLEDLSSKVNEVGVKISKNTLERIELGAISPNSEQLYSIFIALNCKIEIDSEIIIN